MTVLGVVLIVIGVLFLLVGLAGAVRAVVLSAPKSRERGVLSAFDPEKWAKLVNALNETIKLAGTWVAAVIVGGVLVGVGAYLIGA